MIDLLINNLPLVLTALLTVMNVMFGAKYKKWKNVAITIADAIKDDKVTQEEERKIVDSFKALKN